jgi:hypothetical protein
MERRLSPTAFLFALAAAMLAVAGAAILLPHDRYYRYQGHDSGTTRKADWIFERLHFDPTPVDVALIGTSRTAGGLSEAVIEAEYCRRAGRRIHVANLGLPETGRNLQYEIAKEALRTKGPELIVVEINEFETRKPHRSFIVLADAADVIAAPALVNVNFLADIVRLPGRQAELFLQTIFRAPPVRRAFDPEAYQGPHFDRTGSLVLLDGRVVDKDVRPPRAALDAQHERRVAEAAPARILAGPLHALEFRFSRRYLRAIEVAAGRSGARAAYAYLPAYRAPAPPKSLLDDLDIAEITFDLGGEAAGNPDLWFDATHWNAEGARIASERFGVMLARRSPALGAPGPCPLSAN